MSDGFVPGGAADPSATVDAMAVVLPEKIAAGFTFTLPRGGARQPHLEEHL